jgi:hypothetical protein
VENNKIDSPLLQEGIVVSPSLSSSSSVCTNSSNLQSRINNNSDNRNNSYYNSTSIPSQYPISTPPSSYTPFSSFTSSLSSINYIRPVPSSLSKTACMSKLSKQESSSSIINTTTYPHFSRRPASYQAIHKKTNALQKERTIIQKQGKQENKKGEKLLGSNNR